MGLAEGKKIMLSTGLALQEMHCVSKVSAVGNASLIFDIIHVQSKLKSN